MRIDVEIDDELVQRARALTGVDNKNKLVETALTLLVKTRERDKASSVQGHMTWSEESDES
jgi:Arc/MetJ family transcription regulator